jgi:hypothetical protein
LTGRENGRGKSAVTFDGFIIPASEKRDRLRPKETFQSLNGKSPSKSFAEVGEHDHCRASGWQNMRLTADFCRLLEVRFDYKIF